MGRGLRKLTGIANTQQAWEDWKALTVKAIDLGWREDQINKFAPYPHDGWRKIDKCIARLRKALAQG